MHADSARFVGFQNYIDPVIGAKQENIIKVEQGGHLVLGHYSGYLLEFSDDTLISILDLTNHVDSLLNIEPNQLRRTAIFDVLFSTKGGNSYYQEVGTRLDGPLIEFITPSVGARIINISRNMPSLCLEWKNAFDANELEFDLLIKNIFNETVDKLPVSGKSMTIDFSGYKSESNLYILSIQSKTEGIVSQEIAVSVDSGHEFIPGSCDAHTAIESLQMAYYLETRRYYHEATRFYELAAELSPKPFYNKMLNHHLQRK